MPAGTGNCGPAASVRAAPPERHSTGRIAGPHRTTTSPRYSHATRTPARPVGLPRPPGSGQKGVGAGVTTPPYQRPRAAGAFDSFVPERWGPRFSVGCRLQAFNPAWAAFTDDGYVLYRAKRPGSRALGAPTRRRRPHAHPAHASSRSSRHDSGDYRPTKQGGNRAYGRSPATLPVAGFLVPKRSGNFSFDPQPQEDQSLHRVSTLQNGDACVYPSRT